MAAPHHDNLSALDTSMESVERYQRLPECEKTYERRVKADIERRFFKVRCPFRYCLVDGDGHKLYQHSRIARVIGSIVFFDQARTGGWVKHKFKPRSSWLQDPEMREVKCIEFDPSRTKRDIHNTFRSKAKPGSI